MSTKANSESVRVEELREGDVVEFGPHNLTVATTYSALWGTMVGISWTNGKVSHVTHGTILTRFHKS